MFSTSSDHPDIRAYDSSPASSATTSAVAVDPHCATRIYDGLGYASSRYLYAASYGLGAWVYDYGVAPTCP